MVCVSLPLASQDSVHEKLNILEKLQSAGRQMSRALTDAYFAFVMNLVKPKNFEVSPTTQTAILSLCNVDLSPSDLGMQLLLRFHPWLIEVLSLILRCAAYS